MCSQDPACKLQRTCEVSAVAITEWYMPASDKTQCENDGSWYSCSDAQCSLTRKCGSNGELSKCACPRMKAKRCATCSQVAWGQCQPGCSCENNPEDPNQERNCCANDNTGTEPTSCLDQVVENAKCACPKVPFKPKAGPEYVGCFVDDDTRDLKFGPQKYGYGPAACAAACPGFKYIALQDGGQCFCGHTYGTPAATYTKAPDAECNYENVKPTDGQILGKGQGGLYRNAVYLSKDAATASTSLEFLQESTAVAAGEKQTKVPRWSLSTERPLGKGRWELGEGNDDGGAFRFTVDSFPVLTVSTDGQLFGPKGRVVARTQNAQVAKIVNNEVKVLFTTTFNACAILHPSLLPSQVKFGAWSVGLTKHDHLAFAVSGMTQFFVHGDGDMWSKHAGGFLKRASGPTRTADDVLGIPTSMGMSVGHWKVVLTTKNNLAFVVHDHERGWVTAGGIYSLRADRELYSSKLHGFVEMKPVKGQKPSEVVTYTNAKIALITRYTTLGSVGEATECVFPFKSEGKWYYGCEGTEPPPGMFP